MKPHMVPPLKLRPDQGQNPPVSVRLVVNSGPHTGMVVSWTSGRYVIGRSVQASLALPHDLVASTEHCCFEIDDRGCRIRDLDSRSGTHVNGRPVKTAEIHSGDCLRIGMSDLLVNFCRAASLEATVIGNLAESDPSEATAISGMASTAKVAGLLDIPGYTIQRKLGEGGMGVVYEALRLAHNDRVAIKTIIPNQGTTRRAIELFQREMNLLSRLDHPHIVRFLDGGEFAGQIYLVMEYVETVDVQEFAQDLAADQRIRLFCGIACQILAAIDHAHQQKLVHRDVKPRNILVAREKNRLSAKLADFGLAKNFEQAGLSQLTADNEIRGTPAFMPWEQFQNSKYAKPAVDIYSTAATLFYYLTGKSPGHTNPSGRSQTTLGSFISLFTRSQSTGAQSAVVTEGLTLLPGGLAEVLNRALASTPRHRFPTAESMREALIPFARPQRRHAADTSG